jgi:hypothetical protein
MAVERIALKDVGHCVVEQAGLRDVTEGYRCETPIRYYASVQHPQPAEAERKTDHRNPLWSTRSIATQVE